MAGPGQHLPSLTGMRFLAALLVTLYHAGMWVQEVSTAPSGPFRFGYVGVSFFFVLSGFVLTWTWKPTERVRSFYLRRFARVWPLHALTTMLAGGLAVLGGKITADLSALPAHLLLIQAWWLDNEWIFQWNGLSWSLACEAFFYALFPVLVVAFRGRPAVLVFVSLVWLVVGGSLTLLLRPELTHFLYTFPAYRVGEFALGVAAGLFMRSGGRVMIGMTGGVMVAAAGYAAIWAGDRLTGYFFGRELWASHLLVVCGFALAIVAAAQHDFDGRRSWLGHAWLVKLGQWSFALYLIHTLVYSLGKPIRPDLSFGERYVVVIGLLICAIALSVLAYEWFERPVERRIRLWGRARESALAGGAERPQA